MKFENVNVNIDIRRWNVEITITHPDGKKEVFLASADGDYTSKDGIWFGTQKDHDSW